MPSEPEPVFFSIHIPAEGRNLFIGIIIPEPPVPYLTCTVFIQSPHLKLFCGRKKILPQPAAIRSFCERDKPCQRLLTGFPFPVVIFPFLRCGMQCTKKEQGKQCLFHKNKCRQNFPCSFLCVVFIVPCFKLEPHRHNREHRFHIDPGVFTMCTMSYVVQNKTLPLLYSTAFLVDQIVP